MKLLNVLLALSIVISNTSFSLAASPAAGSSSRSHDEIVSLGTAVDKKSGERVEGFKIVRYKDGYGKSTSPTGAKATNPSSCYTFLATGARWKVVEPWMINTTNKEGIDGNYLYSTVSSDIAKWEDAGDGVLNNTVSKQMLGDGTTTSSTLVADETAPDGVNEVYFGPVASPGAIAVTIVWGIFSGPTNNRKLVEWDQVFDDIDFNWSATGANGVMDFDNIATHELGHAVGLGDLYQSGCSTATMYGYAGTGETTKRSLEIGDVTGIKTLYK